MRKRNKKKKGGGCALCKPGKHGKAGRWKSKEKQDLKEYEKIKTNPNKYDDT